MKPAVLVTGGAGYVGSHACKALARAGYLPVVYDNLIRGHTWAVKWGPLEVSDLSDGRALRTAIGKHDIKAVMHFAAYAYVSESMRLPELYFRNNVANTLHLLEVMLDAGVKTIVFSSTCATYGMPQEIPISEEHPQHPISPYGESKRFVEQALRWMGETHGFRWVALRYFNAAGADPEGELGEEHDPETHLVPLAVETALGQRSHIEIYGTDYETPDGTAIRDFVHVTDLADAHVLALGYLLQDGSSGAFNLGTGRGYSVAEVMRSVQRIAGRQVPTRQSPRRLGDPPILVAEARKAASLLGWKPGLSDLDTIVDTILSWKRSPHRPVHIPGG